MLESWNLAAARLHARGGEPQGAVPATVSHEPCPPGQRFIVKDRKRLRVVEAAAVDWLESAGNYVRLHAAGTTYLIRAHLGDLAARLDPGRFERIHRCIVVNMARVVALTPGVNGDYLLFLGDGTQLKLSRTYRRAVFARQFLNRA